MNIFLPCGILCEVLFAAGWDFLETLLPFLFVGFWILSQIFSVFRKVSGGAGQRPQALPEGEIDEAQRRPQRAPKADEDDEASNELKRQIEAFVLGRIESQQRSSTPRKTAERQSQGDPAARQRIKKLPRKSQQATLPDVPPPIPIAASRLSGSAREHHLGSLTSSGTDLSRHVQNAFGHELKHLSSELAEERLESGAVAMRSQPQTPAAELSQLLRNPATVRQVILLGEVLLRPQDRW